MPPSAPRRLRMASTCSHHLRPARPSRRTVSVPSCTSAELQSISLRLPMPDVYPASSGERARLRLAWVDSARPRSSPPPSPCSPPPPRAARSAAPAGAQLRAGAASADITAPVGTPMFAYTARSRIASPDKNADVVDVLADPDTNLYAKSFVASKGIHTRIVSRALVLQQGATKLALVQADLGGLPYALTQSVLERVRSTGIDGDHLLLSATHTHSSTGPIWPADNLGYAALGGDFFDPRIFEITAQGIAEAILRADHGLQAARAGMATVQVHGASRNREPDPFKLNKDLATSPGSINPDLTVLRVDDRRGRPLGLWSNFAVHPTSFGDGNLDFSGDNAGD